MHLNIKTSFPLFTQYKEGWKGVIIWRDNGIADVFFVW